MPATETTTKLLDAAQLLVQERGFNAFSYKDLAEEVGIRTASIHYHFQAKADLGQALMERYLAQLEAALSEIDRKSRSGKAKLKAFIALYRAAEERGAICVCGSLASDQETLPTRVQELVSAYLERSQAWVRETIRQGVRAGEFELRASARDMAAALVASLQGGLVLSRAQGRTVLKLIERSFLSQLQSN